MEAKRTITIKNAHTDEQIASGVYAKDVQLFEGAWYFERDVVNMSQLIVTERIYICPYKGTCYWIDLKTPEYEAENVGFTYFDVTPGYEFVKDKIGLYAGQRQHTYQETSTQGIVTETKE